MKSPRTLCEGSACYQIKVLVLGQEIQLIFPVIAFHPSMVGEADEHISDHAGNHFVDVGRETRASDNDFVTTHAAVVNSVTWKK